MRLLVCGGRSYNDLARVTQELDAIHEVMPITVIIHGAATGADTLAATWARNKGITGLAFPADWNRYRHAAGPIRNKQMLDEGKPDRVVAFPGSKGTANMVKQALAADIPVIWIFD